MGNRAYLNVYLGEEHFSQELMDYKKRVDDFCDKWVELSKEDRDSIGFDLIDHAIEVLDIKDDSYIINILPNLETLMINGKEFYCNSYPFGEYSDSSLDKKDLIPPEWCSLFDIKDRIDKTSYTFNGVVAEYKAYQFRTTAKQALDRIEREDHNSYLVKFLEKFPEDALVVLNYGELNMNDDFREIDLIKTIKTLKECSYTY